MSRVKRNPLANWTSFPEYGYEQFYRENPKKYKKYPFYVFHEPTGFVMSGWDDREDAMDSFRSNKEMGWKDIKVLTHDAVVKRAGAVKWASHDETMHMRGNPSARKNFFWSSKPKAETEPEVTFQYELWTDSEKLPPLIRGTHRLPKSQIPAWRRAELAKPGIEHVNVSIGYHRMAFDGDTMTARQNPNWTRAYNNPKEVAPKGKVWRVVAQVTSKSGLSYVDTVSFTTALDPEEMDATKTASGWRWQYVDGEGNDCKGTATLVTDNRSRFNPDRSRRRLTAGMMRAPVRCADCREVVSVKDAWTTNEGKQICLTCFNERQVDLPEVKMNRSRRNPTEWVPAWPTRNAGPFLPGMFPYGMSGQEMVAKTNPSEGLPVQKPKLHFSAAESKILDKWLAKGAAFSASTMGEREIGQIIRAKGLKFDAGLVDISMTPDGTLFEYIKFLRSGRHKGLTPEQTSLYHGWANDELYRRTFRPQTRVYIKDGEFHLLSKGKDKFKPESLIKQLGVQAAKKVAAPQKTTIRRVKAKPNSRTRRR